MFQDLSSRFLEEQLAKQFNTEPLVILRTETSTNRRGTTQLHPVRNSRAAQKQVVCTFVCISLQEEVLKYSSTACYLFSFAGNGHYQIVNFQKQSKNSGEKNSNALIPLQFTRKQTLHGVPLKTNVRKTWEKDFKYQ